MNNDLHVKQLQNFEYASINASVCMVSFEM